MNVDYIVVGQGLAGSAVAVQLLKLGKRIVVFDDLASNTSSRIAAGLFNPITGKKMGLTWLAGDLFPYLHKFYLELEQQTGEHFFHSMPLYRPFLSIEEQNEWVVRSDDSAFRPYIKKVFTSPSINGVVNPYGGLLLDKCGFVDTQKYIEAVSILIERHGSLIREVFSPDEIILSEAGVSYHDYRASAIIWCTGIRSSKYFDWLPVRPLKGETLSIEMSLSKETIVNRGVYMVPMENHHWRVGATYFFQDRTTRPTEEARKELEIRISELIEMPFNVVDHQWGFRPTTPDRRPILGPHPLHKNLIVFNGLGTKGVSQAPYFSEVLVHWLEKNGTINKEVDIDRFKSLY